MANESKYWEAARERAKQCYKKRQAEKAAQMAKNTWFNEVFLPSLFARAGICKEFRISAKQENVCMSYMYTHEAGTIKHPRMALDYEWNGYNVSVDFHRIYFSPHQKEV